MVIFIVMIFKVSVVYNISVAVHIHLTATVPRLKYTHVQCKRTTLPMRIFVAYQKLCKIVLFIIII